MSNEERVFSIGARNGTLRYSRWVDDTKMLIPGLPAFVPDTLSELELEALLIRFRIEEVGYKLQNNQLDVELRARSPSPPPIYDEIGKRVNTREQRGRDKLMAERQRLVEQAKLLLPSYKPPPDYRPFTTQKSRKIYVPVKDYPDYNFIGLIIGPRGLTQKQMERDTGAKISLRGKGSVREGKGRSATKDNNEDDDLHVIITADTDEAIDHAEQLVRRLLVPVEEGKNDIKREQLRKLAELNGTLRNHEREDMKFRTWTAPGIYCEWCGEISHTSNDCNQRGNPNAMQRPEFNKPSNEITKDYIEFLKSIGEDVTGLVPNKETDKGQQDNDQSYNDLLASIGAIPPSSGQTSSHHNNNSYDTGSVNCNYGDKSSNPIAAELLPWEI